MLKLLFCTLGFHKSEVTEIMVFPSVYFIFRVCVCVVSFEGLKIPTLHIVLYKMGSVSRSSQLILFHYKIKQVGDYLPSHLKDTVGKLQSSSKPWCLLKTHFFTKSLLSFETRIYIALHIFKQPFSVSWE